MDLLFESYCTARTSMLGRSICHKVMALASCARRLGISRDARKGVSVAMADSPFWLGPGILGMSVGWAHGNPQGNWGPTARWATV